MDSFFLSSTCQGVSQKKKKKNVFSVAFMKSPDDAFRISWIKKFIASSFNSTVSLTIVKRPLLIMVLISLLTSFLILSEAAISHLFCITCPVATVVSSIPSPLMVSYCKKALFFHRQCFNMAPSIPNTS